jgi:hypothetical protein
MGFKLMKIFDTPYCSRSISEVWRRWHISLSTWFRDYLYFSMGGNRVVRWRWFLNLFITFVVSGFWHGANWTFVIWGALHGSYLIFSIWTAEFRQRVVHLARLDKTPSLLKSFQVLITFSLVSFAWIFFRANNLGDAMYICSNLFSGYTLEQLGALSAQLLSTLGANAPLKIVLPDISGYWVLLVVAAEVLFLELVQVFQRKIDLNQFFREQPFGVRWSVYYAMILFILLFGVFEQSKFIYFQF